MTRVKGVSDGEANLVTRGVYRGARIRTGQVPEPLRIMARSPSVMWAAGFYELASGRGSAVPGRLKSLASLKVASLVGCVF